MEVLPLENASDTNNSFCYEDLDYCVESTLYRKIMGSVIFVAIWPFVVLDIKYFPLGRPAAALLGATLMVLLVVVPQDQVYIILGERGNLQTLALLVGMMLLSYYYDREGILDRLSLYIFGRNKPFKYVLWKVCILSAVLSAMITNDATCVVLTPLLLTEHLKQNRPKKEYAPLLLGIATSANIGSASTFFGNPQNAFIASNSRGQVSLLIFFLTTLPAAILGIILSIVVLYLCYFRTIWPRRDRRRMREGINSTNPGINSTNPGTVDKVSQSLAESCREFSQSFDHNTDPNTSSKIAEERGQIYASGQGSEAQDGGGGGDGSAHGISDEDCGGGNDGSGIGNSEGSSHVQTPAAAATKSSWEKWKKRIFVVWLVAVTVIVIALLAVPPPPVVSVEFNLGLVPVGAAVATMFIDTCLNRKYAYDAIIKVDWTMILMFVGLFIWLAGFQNTLFPRSALELVREYMDLSTVQGVLFFAVFVAVGSNVLSNVPLVILVVDQLFSFRCGEGTCTGQLTGVLLAWVSTVAGNFTLIGSIANLIVAEKARSVTKYRLGFLEYLKFGFVSTMLVMFAGLPVVYFTGNNVHISI